MSRRFLEVLMVALLIMVTLGVAFQFQNQQTLQRILDEIEDQRVAGTAAPGRGELLAGGSNYPPGEPNSDWVRIEYGEDARLRRADSEQAGREGRSGEEEPSRARPEPEPQGQRQASSEGAASGTASPSGDAEFVGEALPDAAMRDSAAERDGEGSASDAASEETSAAADEPVESAEMGEADEEPASREGEAVASADGAAESGEPESETGSEPEPEPREEDPAWLEHEQLVTQTIEQLLEGEYGQVARRFTPQMARRLQPRQIAEALDPVRQSHGSMEELVSYENVTSGLDEGLHAFRVEVATTNDERLTFTITVDDNGEIDGLFMR